MSLEAVLFILIASFAGAIVSKLGQNWQKKYVIGLHMAVVLCLIGIYYII